jgi:hypothetical protein
MNKLICLAVTGIAAAGLTLATPAESRADHRRGTSLHLDIGGFHFDYNRGYGAGHYHGAGYGPGAYGYRSHYVPIAPDGCIIPRPTIVQPTDLHWTQGRGWHEHGTILVPHRGHYHRYRY